MKDFTINHRLVSGLSIILILVGWQVAATLIKLPLILPTPLETIHQMGVLIVTPAFWHHLGATLWRGFIGFGLSLLIGFGVGVVGGRNVTWGAFFRPFIILLRSTPVMSVIILALIWFHRDFVPIFVTFLMVFPIIVQNVVEGIRNVNHDLIEMTKIYRIKSWQKFLYLYFPSLVPFLAAAISAGLGITWKVLVAAEVLSYPTFGIGAQMDTARVYLQTDKVFAWTVIVIIIGLFLDYFLDFLLKRPFKAWNEANHD